MQPRKQFEPFQTLGDRIFRVPRVEPWRIPLALVRVPKFHSISIAVLIWGFAAIIGIGTILLYVGRKDQQLQVTTEQVRELIWSERLPLQKQEISTPTILRLSNPN